LQTVTQIKTNRLNLFQNLTATHYTNPTQSKKEMDRF